MSKKQEQERSPAYRLVQMVWRNQSGALSYGNFHHGISAAVHLAIRYGLRFDVDDFQRLATEGRQLIWFYADEFCYTLACGCERGLRNPSAAAAYETWKDRKPFKIEEPHSKTPTRIYVGRQFQWKHRGVTCTSFAADGSHLTACEYHPPKKGSYENKVKRRHKITVAEIHTARREAKQRDSLWERFSKAGGEGKRWKRFCIRFTVASGIKTGEQWVDTPTKKLTEAVEQFLEEEKKGTG